MTVMTLTFYPPARPRARGGDRALRIHELKPLFLFRPEPGWSVSAQTARAMGLDVHGSPLFTIEPVPWDAPSPTDYDGILVGSANVFRHGGKKLDKLTKLPVHAVGEATADAARRAGFLVGRTGRGGLQNLLDDLDGAIPSSPAELKKIPGVDGVIADAVSFSGGGALPMGEIPTKVVQLRAENLTAAELADRLRATDTPVIGRISDDVLHLDLRTVLARELTDISAAVEQAVT